MRRFKLTLLATALFVAIAATAAAVIPAIRINGLQITSLSSSTIASGKQGVWVDANTTPRLRYDNGSASTYVAAASVTAKGDLVLFDGTNWCVLAAAGDGYVLTTDSTQSCGVKWASGGGGSVTVQTTSPLSGGSGAAGTSWTLSCSTCIVDGANTVTSGVTLTKTAIGTAATAGLVLQNTTAAALGAQQDSPALALLGNGWATGAGASQSVAGEWQLRPIQGSTPTWELAWSTTINGGALADKIRLTQDASGYGCVTGASGNGMTCFALSELDFYYSSAAASPTVFLVSGEFGTYTDLNVKLGDSSRRFSAVWARHLNSSGTAPSGTAGSGAGSGASVTVTNADSGFHVSITGGIGSAGASTIATVTFNSAFDHAPTCTYSPTGINAANFTGTYETSTTSTWALNAPASGGLSNGTTYDWDVVCVGH